MHLAAIYLIMVVLVVCYNVLSQRLPGGTEGRHPSVRIPDIRVGNQTRHLQNTIMEDYET
jgi:hypothetical protein